MYSSSYLLYEYGVCMTCVYGVFCGVGLVQRRLIRQMQAVGSAALRTPGGGIQGTSE